MKIDIVKEVRSNSYKKIYHDLFMGSDVWYFSEFGSNNPVQDYDNFKDIVSDKLNVHYNNIAIVGSAKNGFSLSPKKFFRSFDEENSDIDVVLVSKKYYSIIWNAYLEMYYKQIPFPEYEYISKCIFKGFVTIGDDSTFRHNDIVEWKKKADDLIKNIQLNLGMIHPIKYRIYESWESVEKYHYHNIRQLKSRILKVDKRNEKLSDLLNILQEPMRALLTNLIEYKQ